MTHQDFPHSQPLGHTLTAAMTHTQSRCDTHSQPLWHTYTHTAAVTHTGSRCDPHWQSLWPTLAAAVTRTHNRCDLHTDLLFLVRCTEVSLPCTCVTLTLSLISPQWGQTGEPSTSGEHDAWYKCPRLAAQSKNSPWNNKLVVQDETRKQ